MPSVMWKELTAADLRDKAQAGAVVVLPVASMEQHGPHLPVGVDTILCEAVCKAAAEADRRADAHRGGADLVVRYGRAPHGLRRHLHLRHSDLPRRAAGFLESLDRHGFKRALIVNGHGGNIAALGAFLPDFARETGLTVRFITYFDPARAAIAPLLDDQDGVHHACEVETSMMMVAAPDTVRRDKLAEAHGPARSSSPPASVGRYRSFRDISASGVIGDARRASADKGHKLFAVCRDGVAAVLRDSATWS